MKLNKSYLAIICIFVIFGNANILCDATNNKIDDSKAISILSKYGIVDDSIENEVSRQACIAIITKAVGITPKMVEAFNALLSYPIYVDYYDIDYNYRGYVVGAHGQKIALGEPSNRDLTFFYPNRNTTLKEAVAFVMRYLEDCSTNISESFERAKEIELIKKTDEFYEKGDSIISPDELYIIVHRMLYKNFYKGFYTDSEETRTKTYLELLDENFNQ